MIRAKRTSAQMSLADGLVYRRAGLNEVLDRVGAMIDWSAIERLLEPTDRRGPGAPGYPAVVLFKAVLLAQWNGLSDEAMEAMLADRLSFQRFCGLGLSDPKPDHTTLWRYREHLAGSGLAAAAFDEVHRQMMAQGLVLKQGTLIDATLVKAQVVAPPPAPVEPPGAAADDAPPPSRLVRSRLDAGAGWTRRGEQRFFGYKAHLAVDLGSGLIRAQRLTGAEVNETSIADDLIQGDETAVYADKAYDSHARSARLKAQGIKNRIQRRANKHHAATPREVKRNVLIGRIRGRVETTFAYFKRIFGYRQVRYFNAARNAVQLALLCMAYNLTRIARLAPA